MKFIVFVQTEKQELMLLILNGELWILIKIHSWIFQGWTQVLISLVFSGFTADTACVTDYHNIGQIDKIGGGVETVERDQTISLYPRKVEKNH